ncbi:hypothetical protein CVT26_011107 [Gymnopilus dilepis]|uniref:Uncharacterized protein n=1 Tax=Gymnopilus dilepis TaxID=231916 RepID=A0A409WRM0_9AGAR|nr:hypothetical protein CVT26_011107 [Gymnopilus dilepis]
MYSAVLKAQRQSNDIIIHSRPAQSAVRIAWPTRNGVPIVPRGVKNYLDTKGIYWECFCALISDVARPCRIVVSRQDGDVLAFCHHLDDTLKCGFFMNLNSKARSTTLFSNYGHISSAKFGAHVDMSPYILSYKLLEPVGEIAPFFDGYLGESTSDRPGIKQLNSGMKYYSKTRSIKDRPSSFPEPLRHSEGFSSITSCDGDLSTSPRKRRKMSISTESISDPAVSDLLQELTTVECHVESSQRQCLERLRRGDGLTRLEYESLVESCSSCNRYFLSEALRSHIPNCSNQ